MSIFKNLFNKSKGDDPYVSGSIEPHAASALDDYKVSLDKVTVNLTKSTGVSFDGLKSKVKLVLDYSASMYGLYNDGTVQEVITKLLPLALKFDDDGELECYLFSDGYKEIEPCTESNYTDYVDSIATESGFSMGGTEYAPVLRAIHSKDTKNIPTFTIFITDGDNSDKSASDDIVRKMSYDNGFVMFVGIGNSKFNYLEKLDNLSGRPVDNTGFVKFSDIDSVSESELYTKLLTEYASWLRR